MARSPGQAGSTQHARPPALPAPRSAEPEAAPGTAAQPGESAAPPESFRAGTSQIAIAGRWRRLAAFAIDALILTLVTGALWGMLLASFADRMGNAISARAANAPHAHGIYGRVWAQTLAPYLIEAVATIVVATVYYWLLTGYWGTTIGKRALGCWVTESDGRSRVSLRRSFVRALVFVAGGELVPPFFVVDNTWLIADARRQALHDKAAGTLVVRRRPFP